VTSVCSGSLVLVAAGVMRGYKAPSHWAACDVLARMGVDVVHERVVVDRNRISGGGVTAGIDFGLVLLAKLRGEEVAKMTQLMFEYDSKPPFDRGTPTGGRAGADGYGAGRDAPVHRRNDARRQRSTGAVRPGVIPMDGAPVSVEAELRQLRRLEIVLLVEGTILAVLVLVAVPLRHLAGVGMVSSIIGPVHGLAFLAYLWTVIGSVSGGGGAGPRSPAWLPCHWCRSAALPVTPSSNGKPPRCSHPSSMAGNNAIGKEHRVKTLKPGAFAIGSTAEAGDKRQPIHRQPANEVGGQPCIWQLGAKRDCCKSHDQRAAIRDASWWGCAG